MTREKRYGLKKHLSHCLVAHSKLHMNSSDWNPASDINRLRHVTVYTCSCSDPGSSRASYNFLLSWHHRPYWAGSSHCLAITITLRYTTFVRTPLDKWSGRRRELNLTTHNTQKRQMFMPPAGFEPAIPATGIGQHNDNTIIICLA
jgi:hypothetical protein